MAATGNQSESAPLALCAMCRFLFFEAAVNTELVQEKERPTITTDIASLKKQAGNNCSGCHMLLQEIEEFPRDPTIVELTVWARVPHQLQPEDETKLGDVNIRLQYQTGHEERILLSVAHPGRCLHTFADWYASNRHLLTAERGSTELMEWVASSLKACCFYSHDEPSVLPTRVLVIPKSPSDPIKLIEGSGLEGFYAALSYCWGGDQHPKLTTSGESNYYQGMAEQDFPQTIRDAFRVTRELDLRYLWIDAHCILQDSDEDMSVEMSRMADVYRNATVTIAACDAQTVTQGFLVNQNKKMVTTYVIADESDYKVALV